MAGGDKVPRKGGPGVTQADLLVINKVDLAEAVGADLGVMERDAHRMRGSGPTVMAAVKSGHKLDEIEAHIIDAWQHATSHHTGTAPACELRYLDRTPHAARSVTHSENTHPHSLIQCRPVV